MSDHSRDLDLDVEGTRGTESGQADQINDYKKSEQQCFPADSLAFPLTETSPQSSLIAPFFGIYDCVASTGDLTSTFEDAPIESTETAPSSVSEDSRSQISLLELGSDAWLTSPLVPGALTEDSSSNSCFNSCPSNDDGMPEIDRWLDGKAEEQQSTPATNSVTSTASIGGRNTTWNAAMNSLDMMLRQPHVDVGCPDVILSRFDRETCGILSVKDGPTENGWRTLVLPMWNTCPALYHALAALTLFHLHKQMPSLRQQGKDHMFESYNGLRHYLAYMQADVAVATSLVLAFAESWGKNITTGSIHIKGAKFRLCDALSEHKEKPRSGLALHRLQFLCSTWVYMDVIARLTHTSSTDNSESDEIYQAFASWSVPQRAFPLHSPDAPVSLDSGVDTLMGCAASLFPIVGHTADLVRRVYETKVNHAPIIAAAAELKKQLESWAPLPASVYAAPEDPQTSVHDCLRTAEAYRWATLLHLFQAVPEIANRPCEELGHQTLNFLAMVPLASRAVIVQIYPLLVAGCEMEDQEMREWVKDRWFNMGKKMGIGVIEASQKVVEEVWRRRDEHELRIVPSVDSDLLLSPAIDWQDPHFSDLVDLGLDDIFGLGTAMIQPPKRTLVGQMDFQYTVRGSLHWKGVMKDWEWEVLLG